ncbi:MAG: peptidase, partial [Bacteroidota bacterium]
RLYSGGMVKTSEIDITFDPSAQEELLERLADLFKVLQINFQPDPDKILSYEIAHKIGLSIKQEYELLCLETEVQRQEYLIEHLKKAVPIISEMEKTKQIIRMNGHFKYFDPLNF